MVAQLTDPQTDRVFRALADSTRRDILRRTMVEPLSVSELANRYDMSFAAVQKHVAVLQTAGLIDKTPRGRTRLIRAEPDQMARVRTLLAELEQLWRSRLTRIDDLFVDQES